MASGPLLHAVDLDPKGAHFLPKDLSPPAAGIGTAFAAAIDEKAFFFFLTERHRPVNYVS